MILGGLGDHFGSQNGTKMASKIDQKNNGFLDRSWKGSGLPKSKPRGGKSTERGRGEVNLSPKGIGDLGNGEKGLLNHWTLQRGWWDFLGRKLAFGSV